MTKNKLGSEIKGEEYLVLHEFAKKAKEKLSKEQKTEVKEIMKNYLTNL